MRQFSRSGRPDEVSARELYLFIQSNGDLYRQQFLPIIMNLARKIGCGIYDKKLAVKLWMYLADEGARRYGKQFGSGYSLQGFDKPTRFMVAAMLARDFMDKFRNREYTPEVMALAKGKLLNPYFSESEVDGPAGTVYVTPKRHSMYVGIKSVGHAPKYSRFVERMTIQDNPAFRGGHLLSGGIDWATDVKHDGDPNEADIQWEKRRAIAAVMKLIGPDLAKWKAKTRFKFTGFRFEGVVWHYSAEQEEMPEDEQGEPSEPKWHYSLSFIGPAAMVLKVIRQFGGSYMPSKSNPSESSFHSLTMRHIKAHNAAAGFYFFSRDTMKHFKSIVFPRLYKGPGGVFFVTSEARGYEDDRRVYKVRQYDPATGRITTPSTAPVATFNLAEEEARARAEVLNPLTRQGSSCYASGMASRNPYTRVRFPAHSSRLFRSKKTGRWSPLPGRRRNPDTGFMPRGTRVGVSMWHSKEDRGLSYAPFIGTLLEGARSGGWDVYDVRRDDGTEQSVYGFSLYRLKKSRKNPMAGMLMRKGRKLLGFAAHKVTRSEALADAESMKGILEQKGYKVAASGSGLSDYLTMQNPRKGAVLIGRKVMSVVYLDEAKARRCGAKNPSIPWKHDFTSADAKVYGLPDGSVLIKSEKKKLWGYR